MVSYCPSNSYGNGNGYGSGMKSGFGAAFYSGDVGGTNYSGLTSKMIYQTNEYDLSRMAGYSSGLDGLSGMDSFTVNTGSSFLNSQRPVTARIDDYNEIKEEVEKVFASITGKELSKEKIKINLCCLEEFKQRIEQEGGRFVSGIVGFALNKKGFGISEVFILANPLDEVMMVIGHELGHVASFPLNETRDEEAKAFAFESAWARKIKEGDVLGIGECLGKLPGAAKNGLHDVAHNFVSSQLLKGREPLQVFEKLSKLELKLKSPV